MDSEDGVIFSEDDFMSRSFDVFEDMRRGEQLVDFKISFENRSIFGHRLVLAARIPYFREIFSTPQEEEIISDEIDPDVLESVINFAYGGKIQITPGNALLLIKASKVLRLPRVHDACWEYLEKRLHSNNVLEFRRLAEDHGRTTFLEAADSYLRQNFEEFANSESFVNLSFGQLEEMISRDDIKVSAEEKVFEGVISWVKNSESERRDLLPELLSAVRMYFLTPDYLIERVSTEELVRSSLLCRDLVEEVKTYHLLPGKRSRFCRLSSQPRIYEKKAVSPSLSSRPGHKNMHHLSADVVPRRSLIYSVCRSVDDGVINVNQFDPEGERWLHVSSYKTDLNPDAAVSLGEVIYIFRGAGVYTFNLSSSKWFSFECQENIFASGVVAYNSKIYFFGGNPELSCNVRSFDPGQKMFVEECRMGKPLLYPGVALLSSSRGTALTLETSIYITGGYSVSQACNDVEKYNPETRQWSDVPPMLYKRFLHGCCNLKDKIYACGGLGNGNEELCSVEVFSPLTNQWNIITSMTEAKCWLSVSSDDDKIYVCGRSDYYSTNVGSIEIYDTKNDEWRISACMPENDKILEMFFVKSVSVEILAR